MIKHNLSDKSFAGCEECRDCCNGKMFSIGLIDESDYETTCRLFPTAFDVKNEQMIFFYSLLPRMGCHYFNGECLIYNHTERPNTCLNYPFGITDSGIIESDDSGCYGVTVNKGIPFLKDDEINPDVMNNFFTREQYQSVVGGGRNELKRFVRWVLENKEILRPIPKITTTNYKVIDVNEFEENKNYMVLDFEKAYKKMKKQKKKNFLRFIEGHRISLDNLKIFGTKILEKL